MAFSTAALAQSEYLEYRKVLDEGGKVSIKTKAATIEEDGQQSLGVSLMYESAMKENPALAGYSLFITFFSHSEDCVAPLDGGLLIRTTSGRELTLRQTVSKGITLYSPETGYENNAYYPSAYTNRDAEGNVYRKVGKYPISEEALKSIIDEGIVQLRLETTDSAVECEYPAKEPVRVKHKRVSRNIVGHTLLPYFTALVENISPYTTF